MNGTGKNAARGCFIVLEGLDRRSVALSPVLPIAEHFSGKTTQSNKLLAYFQEHGLNARIQRFPDRSEPMLGPLIDQFLKTAKNVDDSREVIHLMFAANVSFMSMILSRYY